MDPLKYHQKPFPGKIEVCPTKKCITQQDLSMAYSPGVADPCREIFREEDLVSSYTNKSNLVAVVTDGSAVLGLGNLGPVASKPVMEGKAVLFKRFADIDVFDLELKVKDPDRFIETVLSLEPTFGGINLEDIKAPECFYIEEKLKGKMNIPVFHDDQHGTAIISGAALINALEITGKKIEEIKVVVNGAGAAGIACLDFYLGLGVQKENVILCDSQGVIYKGRSQGMNPFKEKFVAKTSARTLEEGLKGADLFLGLSVGNILTDKMLKSMKDNPIIFALANPDPEILPEQAWSVRKDIIMATGRSDYPNQVNNVLGFPFIFRGALDVQATQINEEMKRAASMALASLAKEKPSEKVKEIYKKEELEFGVNYLIPKPFDERVFFKVSLEVAKAALKSGVAQKKDFSEEQYLESLQERFSKSISRFIS